MKQSDIFVQDKCEITVDKKYTLNPLLIYTNWESQKVLGCARAPLHLTVHFLKSKILHHTEL